MSSFAPAAVLTLHHFEVSENGRGYWVAKDKEGLIGGVFRTQKDALRALNVQTQSTLLIYRNKTEVTRAVGITKRDAIETVLRKAL